MKKLKPSLLVMLMLLLFGSFQTAMAQHCVEVDIELPGTVVAEPGAFAEGTFELINCGDEWAVVILAIEIDINGNLFPIGGFGAPLGAGEIISKEFRIPIPPAAAGNTVTICVTATAGEAEDSDCATMVVEGASPTSGGSETITFLMASADNCVEVELELPDTVTNDPASFVEGYFDLMNCGNEADTIRLSVSIELFDTAFSIPGPVAILGAGETISREFRFPVPPAVVPGSYVFCVTATAGEAMATSCQTVVVVQGDGPPGTVGKTQNYPNPFNPSTNIYFELPTTTHVNLSVFNLLGQQVTTLKDEVMSAGPHVVEWGGTDEAGNRVSTGVYFYRIQAGDIAQTKKMLMVK